MEAFRINGPVSLSGEITPQGAKNEALQILAAVLMTDDDVEVGNLPDILDVQKQIELLRLLNVKVDRIERNTYRFNSSQVDIARVNGAEFQKEAGRIRGSVMMLGPMLGRWGRGVIPKPGGDKIGRRKIDTHLLGLQALGAEFRYDLESSAFIVEAKSLNGKYILLEEASVTGTANIVMAAVLAKGETQIYNAACEPYLQQLCEMLVRMGADISGSGTNMLTIRGVEKLNGTKHTCLPDMIETGSFLGLAAMTDSAIIIKNCAPDRLGLIPVWFKKLGLKFEMTATDIIVPKQGVYEVETNIDGSILTLADAPWPGFTPDLLSIALVVAIQAKGDVLIHQKMFESRLFFTDNLIEMGARILLCDPHRASVMGMGREGKLRGIRMRSPDIRAGVALLIAALNAHGESTIFNIAQIDRGYERIEDRLNALGAGIRRLDTREQ